jgi:predicted 3-demethylubiquinone-9 3-methyltransferase (glyoxalase superfamily)
VIADSGSRKEKTMPRITPHLWFDTQGQEATEFYVSLFPVALWHGSHQGTVDAA